MLYHNNPPWVTLRSRSWVIDFDKFSGKAQVRRATLSCDSSYDWLQGPHIGQNFEKHSKIFSETVKGMKPILCIHVPDSGLYIICVFYSRRIRTLVAMAT